VRAVRRLREAGLSIGLKIVGHYGEDYRRDLHDLAGAAAPDYVEFLSDISDEALAALYRGAAVSVAPSFIEGFSLPVVEAAVCGVPTLASDCDAHRELISHPEALFAPDDDGALSTRIGRAVAYPELREQLLASQAGLAEEFRERVVGRRCWDAIGAEAAHRGRAFSVSRNAKPRIAFLSPFPPQPSGVSRFTELTLQAGSKLFSADLYTDASRPLVGDGIWFRDGGRLHEAVLRRANYDAVVGVLGNSHFHSTTIDLIERFGGPCILHDSRLTQIRYDRLGHDGFTRFAEQLLARSVSYAEVVDWIHDREPPTLFLEPVLRRASPLIVHTRAFQDLLKRQYGVEAEVATFPPNHLFGDEELSEENRRAARSRLGIPDDVFAVVSLGHVAPPKGTACMMAAIDLLRKWGIPAYLYLAGGTGNDLRARQVAEMIGVSGHVRLHEGFLPEEMYRDYAVAADAAVQLRTYGFGQPSAGLTDCVSAAVPTVATESLAAACEAPEFVLTVPDRFSPLHVAQKLAELYTGGRTDRTELLDQRAEFLRTHSFEHYAIRLMESLGYA
jgi:glycosyltransferase involved in cell wall biosynthesis